MEIVQSGLMYGQHRVIDRIGRYLPFTEGEMTHGFCQAMF